MPDAQHNSYRESNFLLILNLFHHVSTRKVPPLNSILQTSTVLNGKVILNDGKVCPTCLRTTNEEIILLYCWKFFLIFIL